MAGKTPSASASRQLRGSVLVEFVVVSAAVLVPLTMLTPILYKYIENRQYLEQAARYAAWERTAYYLSAPSHLPSSAPVKSATDIQREVDNRVLAEGRSPIRREQRDPNHEELLNPNLTYWNRSNQTTASLYEQHPGSSSSQWARASVANQAFGRALSATITDFTTKFMGAGTSGFYLAADGQFRSEVTLNLAELDFFPELGTAPLKMGRSNTLIADGWNQGGPESAKSAARSLNVVGRWGDGTLTNALNTAMHLISHIPLMGALGDLDMGKVEVDAVPCVNLGVMDSRGNISPATRCR